MTSSGHSIGPLLFFTHTMHFAFHVPLLRYQGYILELIS